jgi:NAD(P) transhydrogenase
MASFEYDLVVIGSGPAGQRAAIQAAKRGKKTALVERRAVLGGVCISLFNYPTLAESYKNAAFDGINRLAE